MLRLPRCMPGEYAYYVFNRGVLALDPVLLSDNWNEIVEIPEGDLAVRELHNCINKSKPYGESGWVRTTAELLGVSSSL